MLFRYYGSYEIGGCFALLIVNATEGFWDRLFDKNPQSEVENSKPVKVVSVEKHKPEKKVYTKNSTDKPVKKQTVKVEEDMVKTRTLDIISRVEDDIDQVEFSTQTIDMAQALREFEEKYSKGGK